MASDASRKLDDRIYTKSLTPSAVGAEMERDLLVERTQAGLARAKCEGKTLVRPLKTTAAQRSEIVAQYQAGESVSALARAFAVSRASILGIVTS
jgi:putative DNA-invertase from lambdoid prophage Rac